MSDWPAAPANASGAGELEVMRCGMDMATMNLRPEAEGQLVWVLQNLLINPVEYHKNLQRMAFILAFWFDSPLPKIGAFLRAVTKAAARGGKIDERLFAKHMPRIERMARWYAAKRDEERAEEIVE